MSRTIKWLCLLLAALMMLATLAGCANQQSGQNGDTTTAGDGVSVDPTEEALQELRAEVDWDGKDFGILYINDIGGYTEEVEA